jgi:hypothetical protein
VFCCFGAHLVTFVRRWHFDWLVVPLLGRSVGCFVGWLIGRLVILLVVCFAKYFVRPVCPVVWLTALLFSLSSIGLYFPRSTFRSFS